jgi:hypothetical protein
MVLDNWLGRSVSLNKLLVVMLLAFAGISSHADDLIIADDFKSGDLVSADTFNQIFDTIEKVNRTIVDSDLVGVWSCNASEHSANTASGVSGWTQKGLLWELLGAQINMTATTGPTSRDSAYTISTSAPSPLYTTSSSASSGTYSLFEGMLFVNIADSTATHTYEADIVSSDRITLKGNAELGPPQPTFIVCDSAEAVPASPTSPSVSLDSDNERLTVAWTDASNDESGFKVYRKLSNEADYSLLTMLTGANSYADVNVTEGLTAYYQITSYNDNGESAKSKTVSAIADYTAPTIVAVSPAAGSSVTQADFSEPPAPGTLRVVLSFSEPVTTWPYCDPCTDASLFTLTINGSNSTVMLSAPAGVKILGNTLQANLDYQAGATYVLTLSNEWISDANGNVMEADYSVTLSTP